MVAPSWDELVAMGKVCGCMENRCRVCTAARIEMIVQSRARNSPELPDTREEWVEFYYKYHHIKK